MSFELIYLIYRGIRYKKTKKIQAIQKNDFKISKNTLNNYQENLKVNKLSSEKNIFY